MISWKADKGLPTMLGARSAWCKNGFGNDATEEISIVIRVSDAIGEISKVKVSKKKVD